MSDLFRHFQYTFFNPDSTVGFGISPNPAHMRLRTVTAGRESHPALKTLSAIRFYMIIADMQGAGKRDFEIRYACKKAVP